MPSNKPNPAGLAREAGRLLELESQVKKFASKLAKSPAFAARFDEAVRKKETKLIKQLAKEGGIEKTVTIEEINPDAKITVKFCWFGACLSVTISW